MALPLELPLDHPKLLSLSVGTRVALHGRVITAGAEVHRQLEAGEKLPDDLGEGVVLVHARPQLVRKGKKWRVISLEPEASAGYEAQIPQWLSQRQVRGFLGYGGFSEAAFEQFRRFTGCYFQTFSGTGPALADCVLSAEEIPFGNGLKGPDAMWSLELQGLPAVVTMDLQGRSLHRLIAEGSGRRFAALDPIT